MLRLFCFASFRLYAFVEAAALRSIVLRYAGVPMATRVSFFIFFLLFIWRCRFFRVFFVPLPLPLSMESTSYVFSFRIVFVYLVATGWILDISLCENSISQSINQNPCQVQLTEKIGNLSASRKCLCVRTRVSTVWSAANISESELQATEKDCLMYSPTKSLKVIQNVFELSEDYTKTNL